MMKLCLTGMLSQHTYQSRTLVIKTYLMVLSRVRIKSFLLNTVHRDGIFVCEVDFFAHFKRVTIAIFMIWF